MLNAGSWYLQMNHCKGTFTKKWRQENICKKNGQRDSSSEKYQRKRVEEITKTASTKFMIITTPFLKKKIVLVL